MYYNICISVSSHKGNGEDATKEKVQGHQEVVKGLDYLPSEATIKQLFQIQGVSIFVRGAMFILLWLWCI